MDSITNEKIEGYELHLRDEEGNQAIVEEYLGDMKKFKKSLLVPGDRKFGGGRVPEHREYLREDYKINSINSMLATINNFLSLWSGMTVR